MSHLLEILGKGLDQDLSEILSGYFTPAGGRSIEELGVLCRQRPQDGEIRLQLGLAYLRSDAPDQASVHLRKLRDLCGADPRAALALAACLERDGSPAEALQALDQAEPFPQDAAAHFARGFLLERLDEGERACDCYRRAIDCDGGYCRARYRLAAACLSAGDVSGAIDQYRALRLDADRPGWVHSALGHLYHRAGRYGEAAEEFETAIALEPDNWSLIDDEVESLVAEGQIREAIEKLHEIIEQQGPFADLYVRLGDLYGQVGQDEAALDCYHRALDVQPGYLEAMVKLGTHHLMNGRWDEAADAFCQACDLNDSLLLSYVGLGVCQISGGKTDEGLGSFELAGAVEPNSTLLLSEMARLQLKSAASREFQETLDSDSAVAPGEIEIDNDDLLHRQVDRHAESVSEHPEHADLRYRYGVLLRSVDRQDDAMEQFEKAVEIEPAFVQAIIRLGISRQEMGLVDEAIEAFRSALAIDPEYVDAHYRLGLLYTERRELERAVRHMEKAAGGAAADNGQSRAALSLSLQNMGLMDRAAATWRSLCQLHRNQAR